MMERNDTPFKEPNRLQQISLLLTDVYSHLMGQDSMLSRQEIPELIAEINHNEMNMMMISFSFAYYALRKQLVNQRQYDDAEKCMKEYMGWETEVKKNEVEALHLGAVGKKYALKGSTKKAIKIIKEALKLDPNNPMVLVPLIDIYMKKGDLVTAERYRQKGARFFINLDKKKEETKESAQKNFQEYINKFSSYTKIINNLYKDRPQYQYVFKKEEGILIQIQVLLREIKRHFKGKKTSVPEDQLPELMEDIMKPYFDWLAIVSGATYYILKYDFGTESQKNEIIEAWMHILGYTEQVDLPTRAEAIERVKREGMFDEIKDHVSPPLNKKEKEIARMHRAQHIDLDEIELYVEGWGVPAVIDYEDEEMRNLLINPNDIVINDEKITIEFSYPLSSTARFIYENKGGFSRLELWRCIYEGYKKIYDEEENEVGDPGTYNNLYNRKRSAGKYGIWGHYLEDLIIESVSYNTQKKIITMFIGS